MIVGQKQVGCCQIHRVRLTWSLVPSASVERHRTTLMTNMLHGVVTIDNRFPFVEKVGRVEDTLGTVNTGEECRWRLTRSICGEEGGLKKEKKWRASLTISPSEIKFIDKLLLSVEMSDLHLGVTALTWKWQASHLGGVLLGLHPRS